MSGDLNATFGCLFLACVLTMGLWGVGATQLFFYFERYYNSDVWFRRVHVILVFLVDTAQQVIVITFVYTYLVTNFSNEEILNEILSTAKTSVILTGITDFLAQCFYVTRIWQISKQGGIKSTLLAAFCAACVLAQLGVCLAQYISFRRIQFYSELTHELAIQRAVSAVTAFTDVTIACVLAYLLHMNRSGLRRMDSVINRLILYSFGSGLATGVLAIIALILTLASPTTFVYLLVDLLVPKLYVNSMLALLNSRRSLRGSLEDGDSYGVSVNTVDIRRACGESETILNTTINNKSFAISDRESVTKAKIDTMPTFYATASVQTDNS